MNPAELNAHLSDMGRCIVLLQRPPARSTLRGVEDGVREMRRQLDHLLLAAGADQSHEQYLPFAVDYDCCSTCNHNSGGYVAWPCPVARQRQSGEPT